MKPIFCALALSMMLAPAMAQESATPPVAASQPSSVTITKGLIVTPVVVPDSDWQQMTDTELWRFGIKTPQSITRFNIWLIRREPGKIDEIWNAWENYLPAESELTFGIYPKGGSTFESADTWKIYSRLRASQSEKEPQIVKFDRPNPIKDLDLTTPNRSKIGAQVLPNGEIPLLKYSGGTKENPIVVELILVLVPQSPQPKN